MLFLSCQVLQFIIKSMWKLCIGKNYQWFYLFILAQFPLVSYALNTLEDNSGTINQKKPGVLRVLAPGIFDYQSNIYIVRMRAWGVGFPPRGKPGYEEAISFTEEMLLDSNLSLSVQKEFDNENYKVVNILNNETAQNFSKLAIEQGLGWHNELETSRHGAFVIAQIKAKRQNLGIWMHGGVYSNEAKDKSVPTPLLKSMIGQNPFSGGIKFWVTSFNKIHRPECSFYERGRGEYSRRPTGTDCRICGGTNPRK